MKSHSGKISIPNDFVPAAVPSTLPTNCRGLLVAAAGTVNVTMRNGQVRTSVPLIAGINPGEFASIQSGGTATGIYAVI
jgi:hypothetical protein